VHSSNDDAAFAAHDCGQRFRAADGWFSAIARANKYWIIALDCRRKDNEISRAGVLRSVVLPKPLTVCPSSIRSAAIPLMPLPATPTRCIRCCSRVRNVGRSNGRVRILPTAEPVCGGGCAVTLRSSETGFMSRISLHGRDHTPSRVLRREVRRIRSHPLNSLWILDQLLNFACE